MEFYSKRVEIQLLNRLGNSLFICGWNYS